MPPTVTTTRDPHGWRAFFHPRVITMLFFGFSAGLPILLIFSTLSLRLREAGIDRSVLTLFSWAALGYSFKFVWAPLVDSLRLPWLTQRLGRRRAWILCAQLGVTAAVVFMASVDPASSSMAITYLAVGAVLLGFTSATQDIVIDAYRIESAGMELQALMASTYIAGYRIALLIAGAGTLYLVTYFGSAEDAYSHVAWQNAYLVIAACMVIGIVTTLVITEPSRPANVAPTQPKQNLQLFALFIAGVSGFIFAYFYFAPWFAALKGMLAAQVGNQSLARVVVEFERLVMAIGIAVVCAQVLIFSRVVPATVLRTTYWMPVRDYFGRYSMYSACLLLAIVGLYRISDIVLGVIANVFYFDLGYTLNEIATASKTFGVVMSLLGGLLGGILALRFGMLRILLVGAILSCATNLLFMLLAEVGYHLPLLYGVIAIDNLSAGLASAAFVAFISGLINKQFTATQYAIFSSLTTLFPKILGGYSGGMVDVIGYSQFFLLTTLLGLPVIALLWYIARFYPSAFAPGQATNSASNANRNDQ